MDSVQMRVGSDKTLMTDSCPTPLMTYLNKVGLLHPLQTRLVMVDGPPPPVPVAPLFDAVIAARLLKSLDLSHPEALDR